MNFRARYAKEMETQETSKGTCQGRLLASLAVMALKWQEDVSYETIAALPGFNNPAHEAGLQQLMIEAVLRKRCLSAILQGSIAEKPARLQTGTIADTLAAWRFARNWRRNRAHLEPHGR